MLGYLSPEDKKNLKLASKGCERRVMTLDPAMRKWKITVKSDTKYTDIILPLSKAKLRHNKDGISTKIQLSVFFEAEEKMTSEYIDKNMLLAENILNNWRNNIVALKILIYGYETFLLDKEFKFPKLHKLIIYNGHFSNSEEDLDNNRKVISSALIQNHSETLETLDLGQNVEILVPLKLKKLTVDGLNSDSVSSLLSNCSKTLQALYFAGPTIQSQAMICCSELILRELNFFSRDGSLPPSVKDMISILKACQKTVKTLGFQEIHNELKDELKSLQLGLEVLIYFRQSNVADLPVILKANSSTLKKLALYHIIVSGTIEFDDDLQLSLKYFVGYNIPKNLASILINKSMNTLTELRLVSVEIEEHDLVMTKLPLKKLYLESIHSNTTAKLISSSENLEELRLDDISCSNEIRNKLGKLKRLVCINTCVNLVENLTNLSSLSLTELVVKSPRTCDCVLYPKYDLGNLTEFDCEGGSPEYVSKIINSSYKTLNDVRISKLKNGKFSIEKDLNIRIFHAVDIKPAIVKSLLLKQASALNRLVLKFNKGKQTIESTLLRVLIEFRANNPHCLVHLIDEQC